MFGAQAQSIGTLFGQIGLRGVSVDMFNSQSVTALSVVPTVVP